MSGDPLDDEPIDPGWRRSDPTIDEIEEGGESAPPPHEDLNTLYWWR